MSFKDLWFAEMERDLAERLDRGEDFDSAYEAAGEGAYDSARDKLLDKADIERKRRREDGPQ